MNLDVKEKKGLERLQKRIQDEEILVMKTDKSGKLSVTTREKYIEMGREHTGEDEEIGREKLKEIDKTMSDHATAWVGIWGTGLNHDQTDRIVGSKVSKSENTARLYLLHKDHKKDLKTRPVGTANSSNTMAFANSVSDLIENIANGEKDKIEVISTEDFLHHTKCSNRSTVKIREDWNEKKLKKENCIKCKIWSIKCENCGKSSKDETYLSEAGEMIVVKNLRMLKGLKLTRST